MKVQLSCAVTRSAERLELSYALDNGESTDIGVFNWIQWTRPDGTLAFPPASAYVELVGELLLVRKRALPKPENLHTAVYVPPPASRVRAGSRFEERIVLQLPVQVLQPFRAALLGAQQIGEVVADKPASARQLRLEVGVFPVLPPLQLLPQHPAHPLVLSASPPGLAVAKQQILSADLALDATLPVLDYRAEPWP